MSIETEDDNGFIVLDSSLKYPYVRRWGDSGPEWTRDLSLGLQFHRRKDAEAFAENDEDAWQIMTVKEAKELGYF